MVVIERSDIQGQHEVKLLKVETGYHVVYGETVYHFSKGIRELENALKEYNDCLLHQMGCAGYFDEDDTK